MALSPADFTILPVSILRPVAFAGAGLVVLALVLSARSSGGRGAANPRTAGGGLAAPGGLDGAASTPPITVRRSGTKSSTGRRPPRTAPPLGGWLPVWCADALALAAVHFGLGTPALRVVLITVLCAEAATLAGFVPWAIRHQAWHASDYTHYLRLVPGLLWERLHGRDAAPHRSAFARGTAQRRSRRVKRAWASSAAWRVDEALRRHSPGYAGSGARIEGTPSPDVAADDGDGAGDDTAIDLRLRFPGGIPASAAEAAFREHAASGLLARAAGVPASRCSLVETGDGLLVLRVRRAQDAMAGGETETGADGGDDTGSNGDDASPLGPGLPPLGLLAPAPPRPDPEDGAAVARRVLAALKAQGTADATVRTVRVGPTVTVVVIRPSNGPAAARILRLTDDLRFRLGEAGLMIRRADGFAGCATIEVPRPRRATVALRSVMAATRAAKGDLVAPLGVATDGRPVMTDIADWPHGLVAGATGAGKSVYVNATLIALLLRYSPSELRLLLIDPKRVEFADYRELPHLLRPIVADPSEAVAALEAAVAEMKRRYALLERAGARKLSEYNARVPKEERLPRVLIVIDEAQAIMQDKENAEQVVAASKDLAAMGRAAGVHLLYGTQYPLATTIPSALKANTPTRIALQLRTKVNSMVVLDQPGAEALLGAGDMLVCIGGGAELRRVQSAFLSEAEVKAVVGWWAEHAGGRGSGGDDGDGDGGHDDAAPSASSEPDDALRLLRALAEEVMAQSDALTGAHIAFVRPGECVAVQRAHVERILRRWGSEPATVLERWKAAGWLRSDGDSATVVVRTPWQSRARMVVLEWVPARRREP